jgi:outer membrane murein-binding lipoprotein Lpp
MRPRLIPAAVLLSVLALTGCSASGQSEASLTGEPPMASQDSVESWADESADGGAVRAVDSADGEKMIVTGYLTLTVERPAEAASEVALIVETAGGRVDARTEHAPDGEDKGSAELTVRIPSDELTSTLEAIKKLGTVERVEQGKQNVTAEVRDLESRIKALSASVDRLITLMADADTTADLISIESALSERQANLESLESQKRSLDDRVDLATFTIQLGTEADAPVDEPDTFLSGLAAGWDAFVAFFSFLLVAFGVLLPWLALVGVALLVVVVLVRRRLRGAPSADAAESV